MAAPRAFLLGVCAFLLAIAVANAEAASVVVGLAKCADCARKNTKAEEAFKGLKVAIKCKNVHGDYESKAVGGLDRTGAFSVPLAADLQGADCVAQLHSAASNAPCSGQEPSRIVPVSGGTTYGVVAGAKTTTASPECASVTVCGPIKKHILDHFHHKKPVPPKPEPKPQPHPDYHPVPPTPTYGGGGGHPSSPIYHAKPSATMLGPIKKHILDHFHHKKPVPPKPEPKPQPHPDYHPVPPTSTYGGGGGHPSTPIYHAELSAAMLGPIKKHILDHFHHKKPVPPKPEPKPQPHPDYHSVPPTPTYGGGGGHPSTPIYHAEPSATMLGPIKKHILDHFHHKKPVPPKPEPKPQPHPDYHPVPPTPTYGGGGGHPSSPIYHVEPATKLGPIKKHILDHFHHKKPVPPKPEPKPQPHPDYHPVPPTPTYGGGGGGGHPSTPIYHAEPSATMLGPIKKHILDHFHHKKPVPPKPEPKPQPHPDYHPVPPTPTYGGGGGHPSSPIYHVEPSATKLGPIKKHILDHFHHKKPVPPKPEPKPQPHPDYHPVPPTPTYGGGGGHPSTPIYHAEPSATMLGPIKKHILDHFHHKKPVPPKPEPKPQPHPDYHPVPPTPTYGGGGGHPSSPIYHVEPSATKLGPIKKHILDHFHHKKPVPPKPEPKPQPHPDYHPVPPTPTYGGGGGHPSSPIYHAEPSATMLGPIKKHILDHFHHKKPVPPKPEPKPQPHPDYHPVPPTPTYGGGGGHPSSPIYHAKPSVTVLGPIKKHILDHFHHKKPVPPKPEPKPQPHPDYHHVPPTPTYGGGGGHPSTPIYHAEPSMTVVGPIKKHVLDHFHHKKPVPPKPEPKPQPHPDYHPVPPTPTYGGGHPSSSTPIYHPPAQH